MEVALRIHHIHAGKCVGSLVSKMLTKNDISFNEYYCIDAVEVVRNLIKGCNVDDFFIISTRNPIERFIAAFNLELKDREKVEGEKPITPKSQELLGAFNNVNELAESLSCESYKNELAKCAISNSELHLDMGLACCLSPELVSMLPFDRTVLVRSEMFSHDIGLLAKKLGIDTLNFEGVNRDDSRRFLEEFPIINPDFLSELGRKNLQNALDDEFKVLEALEKLGVILVDKKQANKSVENSLALWGNNEELLKLVNHFFTYGYCVISKGVSKELCDAAVSDYDNWCQQFTDELLSKRDDGRHPRVVNLHSELDSLKQLFTRSTRLLNLLDLVFFERASVYTSLMFQYGTQQPLHRDTPVFRTSPEERYVGVWFALEDATEENGCLVALERAHKGGEIDQYEFAESVVENINDISPSGQGLWANYQKTMVEQCKKEGFIEKKIIANKGDIVVWHPQLPHGGSKIMNETKTRYSIVYHVTPERTPVYQADVFFNRNKIDMPTSWDRGYYVFEGREFMKVKEFNIGSN